MLLDLSKKEDARGGRCLYTVEKKLVKVSNSPSPSAKITESVPRVMKLEQISFTRKDN